MLICQYYWTVMLVKKCLFFCFFYRKAPCLSHFVSEIFKAYCGAQWLSRCYLMSTSSGGTPSRQRCPMKNRKKHCIKIAKPNASLGLTYPKLALAKTEPSFLDIVGYVACLPWTSINSLKNRLVARTPGNTVCDKDDLICSACLDCP